MTIDIGEFRHRVEVQTNTPTKDSHGGVVDSWATTSTVWAKVQTLTGRKLELARQIDAEATVEIRTRYCGSGGSANITVDNRLLFNDRILEPVVVINENELNIALRITCKEKRGSFDA